MEVKSSESVPCFSSDTDLSQVRQLVERWRQSYGHLLFQCQRQREELTHMAMHERLCEDSEKLLRRENAALKEALAQQTDAAARLRRLKVESDALKEDLDDASASLCAAVLEHEAKQAELRRELDSESRARKEVELKLAAQVAASENMLEELEAQRSENGVLAAELEECRKQLKAKEQELRCEVIAVKLERDEAVARIQGRLERLQTTSHAACREEYAALQQELARAREEVTRLKESSSPARTQATPRSSSLSLSQKLKKTLGKDSIRPSESPGQGCCAKNSEREVWSGGRAAEGSVQGNARDFSGRTGCGLNAYASPTQERPPALGTTSASTPAALRRSPSLNSRPVSDGTVDSTRGASDYGDDTINDSYLPLVAVESPGPCVARASFRVSELLALSAQRRGNPRLFDGGRGRIETVNEPKSPEQRMIHEGPGDAPSAMVPETPPGSDAKPKKRRLCLEVDDMLFVDA